MGNNDGRFVGRTDGRSPGALRYPRRSTEPTNAELQAEIDALQAQVDANQALLLDHDTRHEAGGGDEITVEDLITGAVDESFLLRPDGAGGLVMAARGFGYARSTAAQAGMVTGTTMVLNTLGAVAGGVAFAANQFTLVAGRRYLLFGGSRFLFASTLGTNVAALNWYDVNAAAFLAPNAPARPAGSVGGLESSKSDCAVYYEASGAEIVELRMGFVGGPAVTATADTQFAFVLEL